MIDKKWIEENCHNEYDYGNHQIRLIETLAREIVKQQDVINMLCTKIDATQIVLRRMVKESEKNK